ncbi:hypothetical protein Nstercoris_00762 [Nitrosomonas stercoris]|uniref:SPOR domain-containing protein n=1 Tax=Nitrosomonas stercoris TaxID=1444684 RepID=A0A4Y1YKG8_9PROT|nr:hypothetical protein Nstercoris_00762 [Nitrosomonas stercoris]
MKKLALFLLLINIGAIFYFYDKTENNITVPPSQFHPEEIVLLPIKITCLKWDKLVEPIARLARMEISQWGTEKNRITEIPQKKITIHWVHIPPIRSTYETARRMTQLENLDIIHQHIQENQDNPWHNAISLAILTEGTEAAALVEELTDKGIKHVVSSEQTLAQSSFIIRNPTEQMTKSIQQLAQQFPSTRLKTTECSRL